MPKILLTNGGPLEMEAFCQNKNLEWKCLSRVVPVLSDVCNPPHITINFSQHGISTMPEKELYCGKKL